MIGKESSPCSQKKRGGESLKKIYIQNATGGSGKDTFARFLNKYIPTCKYSIADMPKSAGIILGWDGVSKAEKDRLFLSDLIDLSSKYNDAPFKDVTSIVCDFKNNLIEADLLIVDMRSPKDIARAVSAFGAETILIRNQNVEDITSNHADANVENYTYDYIIENNGTVNQLKKAAEIFVSEIVKNEDGKIHDNPLIFNCKNY